MARSYGTAGTSMVEGLDVFTTMWRKALEDAEDMLEGRLLTLERLVVGRNDESTTTVAPSPSPEPQGW